MKAKDKYLFTIDLDGTLLKNSSTSEIDKRDVKAIKALTKAGHRVCIVTGRPWRSSKGAYEELGLNTAIANYNGAHIHNPSDYSFTPVTSYMNLNDVMYILGDENFNRWRNNLAIEGPSWVMLEKRDKDLERVFGFTGASKLKLGIDIHKLPLRPTGVIIDTKKGVNIVKLLDYLQRTYGDLVEFSAWSKGEGLSPVLDMTSVGVTKAKAISLMARYYDVEMTHTIAIGDSFNDIQMFKYSEIPVVMKNAAEEVKRYGVHITDKSNKEAGVSSFINKFLSKNGQEFIDELRKERLRKFKNKNTTTVAE